MKKLAVSLFVFIGLCITFTSLTGCDKTKHWEYRAYTVTGIDDGEFLSKEVFPNVEELNKLGDEGWELVSTYEKLETAHPNFGNDKYVTGLQANTRTGAVVFLFKRLRPGARSDKDTLEAYDVWAFDPVAIANRKAGEEFLEKKAKEPGYKKTASGLVYKVIKEGSGDNFTENDVVSLMRKCTSIDGEVYFQTTSKPIDRCVGDVFSGFAEMLKLMKPGMKVEAIIPSELGSGNLAPHETVIYEIETISAKPKEEKKEDKE